jgi:hypothetical protein
MCLLGPAGALQPNDSVGPTGRDKVSVDKVFSRIASGLGFEKLFEYVLQHLFVQAHVGNQQLKVLVFPPTA